MPATATRYPVGALAGVLHNHKGMTCLGYGVITEHAPATASNRSGRVTVRLPDGTEHTVSDHGDFIEVHTLNATCEKCGADVWRNLYRGEWAGISDVDATGSAKCPAGDFHGRDWHRRLHAAWEAPRSLLLSPADLDLTRAVFAGESVNTDALIRLTRRMEAAPTA